LVSRSRLIELAEQMRLDALRLASDKSSTRRKRDLPRGLILSLLLHSLPLLALISWRAIPVETPVPIPIQLAIEQPPPAPTEPEPPATPAPIRAASDDFAEVAAPKVEQGVADAPPAPPEPPPPVETQAAAAAPPLPPPEPAPAEEQAQLPAAETKTAAVMPPLPPRPAPHRQQPTPQMSLPLASAWPLPLRQSPPYQIQRFATLTGPAAIRDEYCVRALNLTLRHLDMLPLSYLGGRRGMTVLTIRILGDGTINSVKLAKSSGYSDIDQQIQRMIFAVGQYPPLPPRLPGTSTDFTFVMVFPDALQR
jgi:protein TonB